MVYVNLRDSKLEENINLLKHLKQSDIAYTDRQLQDIYNKQVENDEDVQRSSLLWALNI